MTPFAGTRMVSAPFAMRRFPLRRNVTGSRMPLSPTVLHGNWIAVPGNLTTAALAMETESVE